MRDNPIFQYTFYSNRIDWRLGATIGMVALGYAPIALMVAYGGAMVGFALLGILVGQPEELLELFYIYNWQRFVENTLPAIAQTAFYITAAFALLLTTLFAPALSAGSIAGERQRQTLDMLLLTLLSARKIISGKLLTALLYSLFPVGALWSLFMVLHGLGGPTWMEVVVCLLLLTVTAVAFTMLGLLVSTFCNTITTAMMVMYGGVMPLLFLAPALLMFPVTVVMIGLEGSTNFAEAVAVYGWSLVASLNPVFTAIYSAVLHNTENASFITEMGPSSRRLPIILPWIIYVMFYTLLSLICFWWASYRIGKTATS